jgi:hypothetical protein
VPRLFFFVPLVVQALAMAVDEAGFHRARRLPRWERIGHPLDTLTVAAAYAYVLLVPYGPGALNGYIALAAFSTLFVTKDELVHARHCSGGEHLLHALLFVVHPVVFLVVALAWPALRDAPRADPVALAIHAQLAATIAFAAYQALYWNVRWKRPLSQSPQAAA